tara:strand:+ start:123 stop:362 length:240 start_codon:yes stop_codon:yes gene_type:complete
MLKEVSKFEAKRVNKATEYYFRCKFHRTDYRGKVWVGDNGAAICNVVSEKTGFMMYPSNPLVAKIESAMLQYTREQGKL